MATNHRDCIPASVPAPGDIGDMSLGSADRGRRAPSVSCVVKAASVVCRWLVAGVFIAAAVPKIADPGAFAQAVDRFSILPDAAVNAAAILVSWLELVAAVALIAGPRYRPAGAAILFILLMAFTAAVGVNLVRGLDVACGCFGSHDASPIGPWHILRNAALMGLTIVAWVASPRGTAR